MSDNVRRIRVLPRFRSQKEARLWITLGGSSEGPLAVMLDFTALPERFMGTLKRECLHHFIFVSEAHLRRTAIEFVRYYNEARPSQAIDGIPKCGAGKGPPMAAVDPGDGPPRLVARPILGGLHHDYRLAA